MYFYRFSALLCDDSHQWGRKYLSLRRTQFVGNFSIHLLLNLQLLTNLLVSPKISIWPTFHRFTIGRPDLVEMRINYLPSLRSEECFTNSCSVICYSSCCQFISISDYQQFYGQKDDGQVRQQIRFKFCSSHIHSHNSIIPQYTAKPYLVVLFSKTISSWQTGKDVPIKVCTHIKFYGQTVLLMAKKPFIASNFKYLTLKTIILLNKKCFPLAD